MVLLALLIASPLPSPMPRTIYRANASPLCTAIRTTVAPAIQGLVLQDHMLHRGAVLMVDMSRMQAAGADAWIDMDNERLGVLVEKLAHNNITIHQLLDQLNAMKLQSPDEAEKLADLRRRLLAVADKQAETLNVLSGTSDSLAANELAGFKNPLAAAVEGDVAHSGTGALEGTMAPTAAGAADAVGLPSTVHAQESTPTPPPSTEAILPVLEPLIALCS